MRMRGQVLRRARPLVPLAGLVALCVAVLLTSDRGHATFLIPLERFSLGTGLDGLPVVSHEATVRRIARVLREDLKLPLPDWISLHLYATPEMFERGLVADLGLSAPLAANLAGFAAGVSLEHNLLLLEPESRRGAREWMRLVAHEMTHVSQVELAGREGRAAHWLTEGMAEYVAYAVLERLGIDSVEAERMAMREAARLYLAGLEPGLGLRELDEPLTFYEHGRRAGMSSTYRLAWLAADRLVARHGLARLVAYFRAFTAEPDPAVNFERAFGESLADFQQDFLTLR